MSNKLLTQFFNKNVCQIDFYRKTSNYNNKNYLLITNNKSVNFFLIT